MTLREAQAILREAAERGKRTTFAAPVTGKANNATRDRHAEYGAPRH